jgi:hypothetical protein
MPPTRRVVGIDLAKNLFHHAVPVAIEVAEHALGRSNATCVQEFSLTAVLPIQKSVALRVPVTNGFRLTFQTAGSCLESCVCLCRYGLLAKRTFSAVMGKSWMRTPTAS